MRFVSAKTNAFALFGRFVDHIFHTLYSTKHTFFMHVIFFFPTPISKPASAVCRLMMDCGAWGNDVHGMKLVLTLRP
jgi:hypothetical protein